MSILNRLLGRESNEDESCCDMHIEEIDHDEGGGTAADENADRAGD